MLSKMKKINFLLRNCLLMLALFQAQLSNAVEFCMKCDNPLTVVGNQYYTCSNQRCDFSKKVFQLSGSEFDERSLAPPTVPGAFLLTSSHVEPVAGCQPLPFSERYVRDMYKPLSVQQKKEYDNFFSGTSSLHNKIMYFISLFMKGAEITAMEARAECSSYGCHLVDKFDEYLLRRGGFLVEQDGHLTPGVMEQLRAVYSSIPIEESGAGRHRTPLFDERVRESGVVSEYGLVTRDILELGIDSREYIDWWNNRLSDENTRLTLIIENSSNIYLFHFVYDSSQGMVSVMSDLDPDYIRMVSYSELKKVINDFMEWANNASVYAFFHN